MMSTSAGGAKAQMGAALQRLHTQRVWAAGAEQGIEGEVLVRDRRDRCESNDKSKENR